jgi:hypothetical protein
MLSVWGRRSFNGDVLYLRRDLAFVAEMEMPDAGGVAKCRKIAKPSAKVA